MKTNLARLTILAVLAACGGGVLAAEGTTFSATTPPDGLLLEYRFQGNAQDSSGNGTDGKVHGAVRFAASEVGPCAEFDGRGQFIDSGSTLSNLGPEFSIECWVKPARQQVEHADIFGNHITGGFGMVMQQENVRHNRFAFAYGIGTGGWITTKPVTLTPERWQHLAVLKSRHEVRLYLNGILLETLRTTLESREQPTTFVADKNGVTVNAPSVERPVTPSPLSFRVGLGFDQESRCFSGGIAALRVWNKVLAQPGADCTPAQKFEALVNNTSVTLRAGTPSRVFTQGNPPVIEVGFGGLTGVSEGQIKASFTCVDSVGKTHVIDSRGTDRGQWLPILHPAGAAARSLSTHLRRRGHGATGDADASAGHAPIFRPTRPGEHSGKSQPAKIDKPRLASFMHAIAGRPGLVDRHRPHEYRPRGEMV